jgi:pimeloyl-ACP methyl ester carboxylesterase
MRTMRKSGLGSLKLVFKLLRPVSTRLSAGFAAWLLARPPRYRPHATETDLKVSAEKIVIPADDFRIQTYAWGQGPTILLVHGWGGRAGQMGHFVEPLVASGFRVVAMDLPAHGESNGRQTNMIEVCAAIRTVAEHIGSLHALIGHSFGAAMGALALQNVKCTTNKLVMISSFIDCAWFAQAFADFFELGPTVLNRMKTRFGQRYRYVGDWSCLSVKVALANTSIPVLIAHDEDDLEVPFSHARQLRAVAPTATHLNTRGLGHRKILRDPRLIDGVIDFLRQ